MKPPRLHFKLINKASLIIGVVLLILGGSIFGVKSYFSDSNKDVPPVYASSAMLYQLWDQYKADDIEPSSGRTLDKSQNNITTSEGESYTMLRAVWMDDKATFDKSWSFTQDNLQRPSDHLFSWLFGERSDGSYGIITSKGGNNTASDADSDIALSLLMAYSRWNQTSYLTQAKQIIQSIWSQEVVSINGQPVLTADNLEKNDTALVIVNPSYFAPYSYRLFAEVDPNDNWLGLVNNSYTILKEASSAKLDKSQSDGLPPDWIQINRTSGAISATTGQGQDTNYGYDAFRVPWRLALDYQWFNDPRDKQILSSYSFLSKQLSTTGKLLAVYGHDGSVVGNYEAPAAYGADMGYFTVVSPSQAKMLYNQKLLTLYSPNKQSFNTNLDYYDSNWAWFGMALYLKDLPNLTSSVNLRA